MVQVLDSPGNWSFECKMAERWDRADFEDIKRQLTGPTE
jgi:hypothetical protein